MHELSIALSILEIVEQEAAPYREGTEAPVVEAVTVQIGRLSGIEPEALSFAWDVARAGTVADGSELRIEMVAARARCEGCGMDFDLDGGRGSCGRCGPVGFRIVEGREMLVRGISVRVDEGTAI